MPDIAKTIRKEAAQGQVNHISLHAKHSRERGVYFEASWRDTKHSGSRFADDADPVKALEKVFQAKPVRERRAKEEEQSEGDFG